MITHLKMGIWLHCTILVNPPSAFESYIAAEKPVLPVGGEIFRTCPGRPWGPPSLLCNGYRVFPGGRGGRGAGLTPHPYLVARVLEKSKAIPLLILRTCVTYKKGGNLPTIP